MGGQPSQVTTVPASTQNTMRPIRQPWLGIRNERANERPTPKEMATTTTISDMTPPPVRCQGAGKSIDVTNVVVVSPVPTTAFSFVVTTWSVTGCSAGSAPRVDSRPSNMIFTLGATSNETSLPCSRILILPLPASINRPE